MLINIFGRVPKPKWTQKEAIALCKQIEAIAPEYGCHVALTGGLLYKEGERKDADIILYRIRQASEINVEGLFDALAGIGVSRCDAVIPNADISYVGIWIQKAKYNGKAIDFLFPDEPMADDTAFERIVQDRF